MKFDIFKKVFKKIYQTVQIPEFDNFQNMSFKISINKLLFKQCFMQCIKIYIFSVEVFCPERGFKIKCTITKYNLYGGEIRPKFHNAYKRY